MFAEAGGWREADSTPWRRLAVWQKVAQWLEILCYSVINKNPLLFHYPLESVVIPSSMKIRCSSISPCVSRLFCSGKKQ
jgi:hypothetical protein